MDPQQQLRHNSLRNRRKPQVRQRSRSQSLDSQTPDSDARSSASHHGSNSDERHNGQTHSDHASETSSPHALNNATNSSVRAVILHARHKYSNAVVNLPQRYAGTDMYSSDYDYFGYFVNDDNINGGIENSGILAAIFRLVYRLLYITAVLILSAISYLVLYKIYVPQILCTYPVYFDYLSSQQHNIPIQATLHVDRLEQHQLFDITHTPQQRQLLSPNRPYYIELSLDMPDSTNNRQAGMFSIVAELYHRVQPTTTEVDNCSQLLLNENNDTVVAEIDNNSETQNQTNGSACYQNNSANSTTVPDTLFRAANSIQNATDPSATSIQLLAVSKRSTLLPYRTHWVTTVFKLLGLPLLLLGITDESITIHVPLFRHYVERLSSPLHMIVIKVVPASSQAKLELLGGRLVIGKELNSLQNFMKDNYYTSFFFGFCCFAMFYFSAFSLLWSILAAGTVQNRHGRNRARDIPSMYNRADTYTRETRANGGNYRAETGVNDTTVDTDNDEEVSDMTNNGDGPDTVHVYTNGSAPAQTYSSTVSVDEADDNSSFDDTWEDI